MHSQRLLTSKIDGDQNGRLSKFDVGVKFLNVHDGDGSEDGDVKRGCSKVIIGIKLEYLRHNKLPRIIFVLMHEHDYIISCVVTGAGSSALIDGKVS